MHSAVIIKNEQPRKCGTRKVGGLYLVSDGEAQGCGKMPIPFEVCPCCGGGIKPSRAPEWIKEPTRLWEDLACTAHRQCISCPVAPGRDMGPALLIWVGEKYYGKPIEFIKEAALQGISRRIAAVPKGFKVGITWVLLAHRKAVELPIDLFNPDDSPDPFQPGLFRIFKPTRIEVICDGKESDDLIESYLSRGLTPVLPVYPTSPGADAPTDSHWTELL